MFSKPKSKLIRARQAFRAHLETVHQLEQDRWGHYKFIDSNKRTRRVKMQPRVARIETKGKTSWHRTHSLNYTMDNINEIFDHLMGVYTK